MAKMLYKNQTLFDWEPVKLGDEQCFEILGSGIDKFEEEKNYLSTSSIEKNRIKTPEGKITYQERPSRANMQPRLNSVWFARMKDTIKVYSFTEENKDEISRYILSTGFAGILCNANKVLPKYVEKIFLSKWFNNLKDALASDKAIQKSLNNEDIVNIEIPLPPPSEQKKIVYVLDSIQDAIRAQEKIIEKTKELKKSMMVDLFKYGGPSFRKGRKLKKTEIGEIPENWEVVELGEIIETTSNINLKRKPNKKIKYIDVSSISSEFLKIIEFKEYYGKNAPSRARKKIKTGDILFATVRPYLKRVAIVSNEFNEEICSTAFCIIRCKDNVIDRFFLFNYISTNSFIDRVTFMQTGANYPAVSDKDLFIQKVPLPSPPEQREIAEILQTIDQKIEIEQKKK
ncbi:MAG: restriction endonuclease subunit S, partial [Candidatus Pacebacteria bacterium]|nr:restriction endonuclease subunit S [Candidatus Paceibacterota bacterium]